MKIISIALICSCCVLISFSQKSVKIRKENTLLYKGVERKIENWYIYQKASAFYLCPLNLPQKEVAEWFEKRVNSQNIYKGFLTEQQYAVLSFRKENDPTDVVSFYYKQLEKAQLELISTIDGNKYTFVPILEE